MTKQQEIDRFNEMAAAQPEGSYLRSIMTGIAPEVESAIRNDFGFIDGHVLKKREEEVKAHEANIAALQKRVNELLTNAAHMKKEHDTIRDQLFQIRADALHLYQRITDSALGKAS